MPVLASGIASKPVATSCKTKTKTKTICPAQGPCPALPSLNKRDDEITVTSGLGPTREEVLLGVGIYFSLHVILEADNIE